MSESDSNKANINTVYTELCHSYRAIDDFRSKLLSLLPLATGGLFFFITNPSALLGESKEGKPEALQQGAEKLAGLPNEIIHAIGLFGVFITLGLFCYELYGIRKCTTLIYLGKRLEKDLGDIKGQFTKRPDGVLAEYFGNKFNFLSINEPFAAGIIYPTVMAAWTFIATFRMASAQYWAIGVFAGMFLLSMWFMWWLVNKEVKRLNDDLKLKE